MMGQQSGIQEQLFFCFSLENHVPKDHLLRGINRFLDLGDFRQQLAEYYSPIGRPSIDPELMIRMLILGYCFGIRSERRLCEEVHLNLAYRWFCKLDLEDAIPDHSTFSKNRHGRFRESQAFRKVFEHVLRRCMTEGLVGGEGFATDASIIKADVKQQRRVASDSDIDWGDPDQATRPIREYLAALEETNDPQPTKEISLTDPAASWTAAAGGFPFFAYSVNYLVDLQAGIIVDVDASAVNKTAETEATQTMIERVEDTFGLKPERLVGDTNYGTATILGWLVDEKQIAPHVPVWDKSERKDGTFNRAEFTFDAENNRYICPAGKLLKTAWRSKQKNPYRYRASQLDCQTCRLKEQCCPNMTQRNIDRSPHESARDVARAIGKTDAYKQSSKERKKVEMLFAHLKRILRLDKLRLRGFNGARDEFLLAATAQNLRRMAKIWAINEKEAQLIPA
ncbi:IS5 family transposase [Methylomonas sp. LWB]|uniref:IS5/IS1182 family transposase n=1 Tax=Methylomonas sp. LWB TaxID=1905845 RepID=UPI0008D9118D|nr:IS5/IS1182 family transposase [Methylomonas sp. LWB]OHX36996.1 IS5 family transposase [Methylomonas sp. LWB]